MKKILFTLTLLGGFSLFGIQVWAQALTPTQIDSVVQKSMETFNVPGMAVAVLKDGKVVLQKGYGVQSLKTQKPVNTQTLFGVASNTKAFTTAAIAQLVDAGKLTWDTPVTDIIPEFKLYDSYATREFTVRDLVIHRGGLGLGMGDLMVLPATNTTGLEEMMYNLRYLKPVSSFRSAYHYNNLMYIVAGEVVARVSGEDYEDYITHHFFEPLGMDRATMDFDKIEKDPNRIDGHAPVNGKLQITLGTFTEIGKPAAGIYASIEDMSKWVQARLDYGRYGKQLQDSLFSRKQAEEMWTAQMNTRVVKGDYNTHFSSYALGWGVKDVMGYLEAGHTGGLFGIVSQVSILPELGLGIIVLTNQESGPAFLSVTSSIKDAYLGIKGKDRIKEYNDRRLKAEQNRDKLMAEVEEVLNKNLKSKKNWLPEDAILGNYNDDWFGQVKVVSSDKKILRLVSEKSPDLKGNMIYYKGTTYVVKWDDASMNADAYVNFDLDENGKAVGFKMKAVSPLTDFSFDFQNLHFKRS